MDVMSMRLGHFMVLLQLGFERRWWTSFTESPLVQRSGYKAAVDFDNGEGLPAEAGVDDDNGGEEGADGEAPEDGCEGDVEDVEPERRQTAEECRKQVNAKLSESKGKLHFSAQLLGDDYACRIFTGLCHLARPLMRTFGEEEIQLGSREGTATLFQSLAHGHFIETMREMFSFTTSTEYARLLGYNTQRRTKYELLQDQKVASTIWRLLWNSVAQQARYNFMHRVPPLFFLALAGPSENRSLDDLTRLKGQWEGWIKLESQAQKNAACRTFVKDLVFTDETWTREQMLRLFEALFQAVPTMSQVQFDAFCESFLSSLICERLFNILRSAVLKVRTKKFGAEAIWHHAWDANLLAKSDRKPLEATEEGKRASAGAIPKIVAQACCKGLLVKCGDARQTPRRPSRFPNA